ncbi:MAG: alpha/beta fold hydrolase [SAR202 cluster bacterium]|nr:alpha/beta fold hydrolase [SAR202 cluster bacterium]
MPILLLLVIILASLAFFTLLAVSAVALWVAYDYVRTRRYPVDQWGHPSDFPIDYEDVSFPSRHDLLKISGWYLPSGDDSRCLILLQGDGHHRNSPGIRALLLGRDLAQHGYSVLLFDFRGRGDSRGHRGSAGDRERWDLLGALDYVNSRGIPTEKIGLVGFSLGAAVALLVADQEKRIPALVSDSCYLDTLPDLENVPFLFFTLPKWFRVPTILAGKWFLAADFSQVRPVKMVHKIAPRPVFFIHGQEDHVVPYRETIVLHQASKNPNNQLWIVPGAGHVHTYATHPKEYLRLIVPFFNRHIPKDSPN